MWRVSAEAGTLNAVPLDLGEHGYAVADAGFGVDDTALWTATTDGQLVEWAITDSGIDLASDAILPSLGRMDVSASALVDSAGIAVHPRERVIVAADLHGVLYRWRLGKGPTVVRPIATEIDAQHVDLFPDGQSVVVGGRGEVWVGALEGDRADGDTVWRAQPGDTIRDVAMSGDGRRWP